MEQIPQSKYCILLRSLNFIGGNRSPSLSTVSCIRNHPSGMVFFESEIVVKNLGLTPLKQLDHLVSLVLSHLLSLQTQFSLYANSLLDILLRTTVVTPVPVIVCDVDIYPLKLWTKPINSLHTGYKIAIGQQ